MLGNLQRTLVSVLTVTVFGATACSDENTVQLGLGKSSQDKSAIERNGASAEAPSDPLKAPRITGIYADIKDAILGVNQQLKIYVVFDTPVQVVLRAPSNPTLKARLMLETGTLDGAAVHEYGNNTNRLTFTYTVKKGHDTKLLTIQSQDSLVVPNGLEIQSVRGIKANTTIPADNPGADLSPYKIRIDGIAPQVEFRSAVLQSDGIAPRLKLGLNLIEENGPLAVHVFAGPTAVCNTPMPSAIATSQPSGAIEVQNIPVRPNDTTFYAVRVFDRASNFSTCKHVYTYKHDNLPPRVSQISRTTDQLPHTRSLPVKFGILFSEAIDPATFGPDDLTNSPESTAQVRWQIISKGDNRNFEIHAIDATDGFIRPVVAAAAVSDPAGNKGPIAEFKSSATVEMRTAPLTVVITRAIGQSKETTNRAINFQVRFSHPIQLDTFSSSDISQVADTGATVRSWVITKVDNRTFNLRVYGITGNGRIMPRIPEAAVTDRSGYMNAASIDGDDGVIYDTNAPLMSQLRMSGKITSDGNYLGRDSQPSIHGQLHDLSSTTVTLFSDMNCEQADQTLAATSGPFALKPVNPLIDGTVYKPAIKAVDGAGNSSPCIPIGAYLYDSTQPTITSVAAISQSPTYLAGQRLNIGVQFSEPVEVSGVPVLMLNSAPGGKAATYVSGSGSSSLIFQYDVAQGENSAKLAYLSTQALQLQPESMITDVAGNAAQLALPAPGLPGSLDHANAIRVDALNPSFGNEVTLVPGTEGEETSISIQITPSEPLFEMGLYADPTCTRPLARETMLAATTRVVRIPSILSFATTSIFALGKDTVGNLSGCVLLASYKHRLNDCKANASNALEPDPADPYLGQFINALNACLPAINAAFEPVSRVDELMAQREQNWSQTIHSLPVAEASRLHKLRQYFVAMKGYQKVLQNGLADDFNSTIAQVVNRTSGDWSVETSDLARIERMKLPSIALVSARLMRFPSMAPAERAAASSLLKNLAGTDVIAFFKSELSSANETRDQVLRSMRHFKVQLRLKLASKDGFKPTFLSAKYGSGVTPDFKASGVDTGIRSISAWYLLKPKTAPDGGFPYLCEFLPAEQIGANIARYYSPEDIHYIDDYHLPCPDLAGTDKAVYVLQVIRKYFPGMMVGFYGYAPHVEYWYPQKTEQNEQNLAAFGKYVDMIMPSAYLMYPTSEKVAYSASGAYSGAQCDRRVALHHNRDMILGPAPAGDPANNRADIVDAAEGAGLYTWKQKRKSLMQEARRLSNASYGQPVLPFLWPQYHERSRVILTSCRDSKTNGVTSPDCLPYVTGNQYMTATALMIKWGADGVIHWDQAEGFNTWYPSFSSSSDGVLSWYEAIIDRPQLQRLAAKSETCVNACPGTWDSAVGAYCQ
ncbi:MAG: hypothetical protein RIQ81_1442 [Pseudomonadota bacterium]|jgi:hypothetical protein